MRFKEILDIIVNKMFGNDMPDSVALNDRLDEIENTLEENGLDDNLKELFMSALKYTLEDSSIIAVFEDFIEEFATKVGENISGALDDKDLEAINYYSGMNDAIGVIVQWLVEELNTEDEEIEEVEGIGIVRLKED